MQRILLGLIAAFFLFGGLALKFAGLSEYWSVSMAAIAMRIGLVLGALWLALPQVQYFLERLSPAIILAAAMAGMVLTIRPRLVVYVVPLFLVILIVHFLGFMSRPPPRRRKKAQSPETKRDPML